MLFDFARGQRENENIYNADERRCARLRRPSYGEKEKKKKIKKRSTGKCQGKELKRSSQKRRKENDTAKEEQRSRIYTYEESSPRVSRHDR